MITAQEWQTIKPEDGTALSECRKLRRKPHSEKKDFLSEKGLSFACLKHGHMSNNCTDKAQCQECSRQHKTLLHYE